MPKYHENKIEAAEKKFLENTMNKFKNYIKAMENVEIREGIKIFMEISSLGNGYLQNTKPWDLMKKKIKNQK